MNVAPTSPKIYHITHVDNLAAIVASGCLLSDAAMDPRGGPARTIGMNKIKQRRLEEIEVSPHPGTKVGDYVPFNFCPRSDLKRLDWPAIEAQDFRAGAVREAKQAEFLVHGSFPFELIEKIGAATNPFRDRAIEILAASDHRPAVEAKLSWYF